MPGTSETAKLLAADVGRGSSTARGAIRTAKAVTKDFGFGACNTLRKLSRGSETNSDTRVILIFFSGVGNAPIYSIASFLCSEHLLRKMLFTGVYNNCD